MADEQIINMKREWSVRTLREGDEEGIYELWQAVYPLEQYDRASWLRWWRWKYRENPAGTGQIWVADHRGKIVGQDAFIFMQMKVGNEILKACQNVDLVIHPDYRYQSMFTTLAREALDELGKQAVHITIGFPNEAAIPGHKKSGWFDIATMKIMLKPLNWKSVVRLKIRNRLLSEFLAVGATLVFDKIFFRTREAPAVDGLAVAQVTSFDERFDRLFARVSGQYPIMVVSNKDHLNWRFSAPGKHYSIFAAEKANEVRGYLVLRDMILGNTKMTSVFYMIAESEEVMHCLVSAAEKVCQRAGVDRIVYSLIADRTYHRVLRRNGFISLPFRKGAYFCAYSSATQISKTFLQDPKNWLVQIGDSDAL